tara:strand:- start:191 stop:487 length:297 start_codon:yes stop_codon:yes gene_type:complete
LLRSFLKKILPNAVRKPELSLSSPANYTSGSYKLDMPKVTIDDKEYDTDNISEEAKKQLASLQFCSSEVNRLQGLLAVTKTAQAAYTKALKDALEQTE